MTTTKNPAVYRADVTYTLRSQTCCECGVLFGLELGYDDRRREDHKSFYCPNGHSQHYTGKTAAQKLQEQLDAARSLAQREAARRRSADYQARAYKGHATRLRNRIAQGFCPAGCDQQFPDVQGHLAAEHPEFKAHLDGEQ